MTKDEALRMAIEALETAEIQSEYDGLSNLIFKAIQACKEALAETQEPTKEEILGKVFDAVYAQHQPKAETQEPVEGKKIIKSYEDSFSDVHLKPPSREWQSLTKEEVWKAVMQEDMPFHKAISEALREKNNG
jgi:hypothetical protein